MDEPNATALPEHHMGVVPFPPIKTLFQDSWHLFTEKALKLLLLYIYTFLTSIASFAIFGVLLAVTIFPKIAGNMQSPEKMLTALTAPDTITTGIILLLVFIAGSIALGMAGVAALPLIFSDTEDASAWTLYIRGFRYIVPLFITGLIAGLLTFGGYFLFFIPGVIMSLFFSFMTYVVVLEKKRFMEALRMSAGIWSQHFGQILGRILLFVAIYILIFAIFPAFVREDSSASITVGIVLMFASVIFGWYSAAYMFLLFKHARGAYDGKKETSMTWIWVVSVIGWIIAIIIGFFVIAAVTNNEDSIMSSIQRYQQLRSKDTSVRGSINDSTVLSEVNVQRVNAGLPPLEYDQPLCAYATHRLKQLKDFGGFDDYGGFIEDISTKEIWNSYFRAYSTINTFTANKVGNTEKNIAKQWSTGPKPDSSTQYPEFTNACVRSDDSFVVIVVGKHK